MNSRKIKAVTRLIGHFGLLLTSSFYVQAQNTPSKNITSTEKTSVTQESKQVNSQPETSIPVMSREEKLIRDTYGKITIYEVAERIKKAERENKSREELTENSLRFKLRDFHIGPIQEILDTKYEDLVTSPAGEIVQIVTGTGRTNVTNKDGSVTKGEEKFFVNARWKTAQYSSGLHKDWTVKEIIQLEAVRFNNVGRYATYEVTVSLEGKTRTYRAMVFFRNSHQSGEKLDADFLDTVVGMGGVVTEIYKETKLPIGMVYSSEARSVDDARKSETYRNTVKTKQLEDSVGTNQVDSVEFPRCGAMTDFGPGEGCNCVYIYAGLCIEPPPSFPTSPPPTPAGCPFKFVNSGIQTKHDVDPNATGHNSGNHEASSGFESHCIRDVNCNVDCKVVDVFTNFTDDENGRSNTLWFHVGRANTASEDHSGVVNQDVTCKRTNGFGFKYCFFRDCTFSLSVNIAGVVTITPSDSWDLWNVAQTQVKTCRMSRNN